MRVVLMKVWDELIGRWNGPFAFRFILQPLVAAILAVRAGLRDARISRPAYGWAIITDSAHFRDLLREGWKDVARLFFCGSPRGHNLRNHCLPPNLSSPTPDRGAMRGSAAVFIDPRTSEQDRAPLVSTQRRIARWVNNGTYCSQPS